MEAAIVLPIIILVVITVVLIIMFFYSQIKSASEMHVSIRMAAGELTGKTYYARHEKWDGSIKTQKSFTGGIVRGKETITMKNKGVLRKHGTYVSEGLAHATDGVKYVRYCNIIKDYRHDDQ